MEEEQGGCLDPVIFGTMTGLGCAMSIVMGVLVGLFLLILMVI